MPWCRSWRTSLVLLLRSNGVDAAAIQAPSAAVFADLPVDALRTQVVVPEEQLARARELIAESARAEASRAGRWPCPSCGEPNAPSFEVCWSCQAPAPS